MAKFVKGQSGNPATQFGPGNPGRPKGSINLATHIRNLLNDENFEILLTKPYKNSTKFKGAPAKAIVLTAIHKAVDGDHRWADWLAKYGYGTKIELSNDPDNPVTISADKSIVDSFLASLKNGTRQTKSD